MDMDKEQVLSLARLARLAPDDESVGALAKDLGRMMDMVRHVQDVDTSALEGVAHVHEGSQRLREDVAESPSTRLEGSAKESKDGFVVVPKVLP